MSDKKRDLTRIEDLGEYLHDLTQEDEELETPDFSEAQEESEEVPSFESDLSSFPSTTDSTTVDFSSSFETSESKTSQENDFESNSFESSTSFETSDFESDFNQPQDIPVEEHKTDLSLDMTPGPQFEKEREESRVFPEPKAEPTIRPYVAPENFEDLKKFAENTSFTGMGMEGNPSFSVLIKNVRFIEDVNDIVTQLKELSLVTESEDQLKGRLMRGSLLVPRISEYSAIFLAHKLRRFDIDIQVGLSDEIHPPKHQEKPETGMVSKHSLYQNQSHNFHFDDPKLEISQIIVAATPGLEGHQVLRYIGVASEHKMLEGHIVEDETSDEIPHHYTELAQKLKAHALKAHANAVVGLNYQLTPMPSELGISGNKYRLTCTGNLVWVNKL